MTYERDPAIASLAARAWAQVRAGIASLRAGEALQAEVYFNAAHATLQSLLVLLEEAPAKPMRKLVIVGTAAVPHDETMPDWFERKANDDGGDGDAA